MVRKIGGSDCPIFGAKGQRFSAFPREAAEMTECEYDRLTVLSLRDDGAGTVRARYGATTEPCETQ